MSHKILRVDETKPVNFNERNHTINQRFCEAASRLSESYVSNSPTHFFAPTPLRWAKEADRQASGKFFLGGLPVSLFGPAQWCRGEEVGRAEGDFLSW